MITPLPVVPMSSDRGAAPELNEEPALVYVEARELARLRRVVEGQEGDLVRLRASLLLYDAEVLRLRATVEERDAALRKAKDVLEDYLWGEDEDVAALAETYGAVCEALGLVPFERASSVPNDVRGAASPSEEPRP